MRRQNVTVSIMCLLVALLQGMRGQALPDTARTYHQSAVVVSAARLVPRSAETMGSVVRLDGWSIRRLDGRSLDAVLEEEGGLFIRDIGGPGGVKTASLRNAPATQTVVQLNGMRLNHPQNSLVDLGLYPAALFDAVEVVRGGQSLLFGSDANAGAIVLGLWPSMSDRLSAGVRWGSFGERGVHLRWDQAGEHAATTVRFGRDASDGDFPFTWSDANGTTERTRDGASHDRWHAAASAVIHGLPWGHIEAMLLGVSSDRGSPGPVTSGPTTLARLRDKVAHAVLRTVHEGDERNGWESGISASYQEETYEEGMFPNTPPDRFTTRVVSGWYQARVRVTESVVAGAGFELSHSALEGHAIAPSTRRFAGGVTSSFEWVEAFSGLRLVPMIRWDAMSDQRPTFGPRIAFEVPVLDEGELTARGSIGTGVRTPNFNELYWQPGGDPALRPERVTTADAGLRLRAGTDRSMLIAVNVFFADTRDRITGWPPVNLARTISGGGDANIAVHADLVRWWANGTLAIVESKVPAYPGRQVPYVPRWIASTGLDVTWGPAVVSPVVRYSSRRFTTLDNLAALSLDPSVRISISGKARLSLLGTGLDVGVVVENLFDAEESSVPGYPLPGRSYRVHASLELL